MATTNYTIEEIWRLIPGWDAYEVSTLGRVRRVKAGGGARVGRILKTRTDKRGYCRLGLYQDGRIKDGALVHQLVALAFIGPRPAERPHVNHKDTEKTNNCPENLEYVTLQQNIAHAVAHGLFRAGSRHYAFSHPEKIARGERRWNAKLTEANVREIKRRINEGHRNIDIARDFGVSDGAIIRIKLRQTWRHVM